MSVPKYPQYKDSGVSWLGPLPSTWTTLRARRLFEIKKRIVGELGFDVLSITQAGIRVKDTESNDGQVSMDYSKYQLVEPGDFAMNHMDLLTGFVDIASQRGVTSPDYRVFSLRQADDADPKYMLYLFQNGYINRIFYAFGQGSSQFGRWRMPTDQFNELTLPYPPLAEQVLIAAFLDREIAKIATLVEEQRCLIELLREKRHSVISRAVTKGLARDVPMKDSGAEWLGLVPAHWDIVRLKHATSLIIDCPHDTPVYDKDGEFAVIRTADISDGVLDLRSAYRLDPQEYERRTRRGTLLQNDIVYSREGERWGHAALVPEVPTCCLGQRMMQFRASTDMDAEFLMWMLNAECVYRQGQLDTVGATSPHVNVETIRNFVLTRPPLDEQRTIAAYVNQAAQAFDGLIGETARGLELLVERRASLISGAVTGKIDVRGLVSQTEAAAA